MKFLNGDFSNKNVIPLNIYYTEGSRADYHDDFIDIIFKDLDTGKKHVETIINPFVEVWIVKEEFRNFNYIKNFIDKDKCYPVKVRYKTRHFEVAKLLKVDVRDVKYSPYVSGLDLPVEHFYYMEFIKEYPTSKPKKLSAGFLDIEADIIRLNRFPEPGEVPVNVVTYIDGYNKQVYTLILTTDNLPDVNESNTQYDNIMDYKKAFKEQVSDFACNIDSFIADLKKDYDESYGDLGYNIVMFDDERELLKALFAIIQKCDNDFVLIWNMPFDVQYLICRMIELGMDVMKIMIPKEFYTCGKNLTREIYFKEDKNAVVHKRKHICRTFTLQTYICQMWLYCGIRSGRGKLPSAKLNWVAQKELKDSKLDYSEEGGSIKTFPYRNFKKFIRYNIKDVLLQLGLLLKTKDLDNMYSSMYGYGVSPYEIFTSTVILINSIRMFIFNYKDGYVLGSNRHKLYPNKVSSYEAMIADMFGTPVDGYNEDEDCINYEEDDEEIEYDISDYTENPDDTPPNKKKKYKGAWVMSPAHMASSGFELFGVLNKFIHELVIDMDITSEYPTAIIITNCSNDTLIGKIFFENPEDVNIPIYDEFTFTPDERKDYKMDPGGFMMETYSQKDPLDFGKIFLNLPPMTEIFNKVDSVIDSLTK